MKPSFTYMANLQYEVKNLRKQAESFQSGERCLYEKSLEKAKEEYGYEPPGEYFKDGYNLYHNAAENAARKFKRKNAQAMSFRSEDGRDYFCDGLSVMEGMEARGENMYEGVTERFQPKTGTV